MEESEKHCVKNEVEEVSKVEPILEVKPDGKEKEIKVEKEEALSETHSFISTRRTSAVQKAHHDYEDKHDVSSSSTADEGHYIYCKNSR